MIHNLNNLKGAAALELAAQKIAEASRLLDHAYCGLPPEWQAQLSSVPSAACVEAALAVRLRKMAADIFATEGVS